MFLLCSIEFNYVQVESIFVNSLEASVYMFVSQNLVRWNYAHTAKKYQICFASKMCFLSTAICWVQTILLRIFITLNLLWKIYSISMFFPAIFYTCECEMYRLKYYSKSISWCFFFFSFGMLYSSKIIKQICSLKSTSLVNWILQKQAIFLFYFLLLFIQSSVEHNYSSYSLYFCCKGIIKCADNYNCENIQKNMFLFHHRLHYHLFRLQYKSSDKILKRLNQTVTNIYIFIHRSINWFTNGVDMLIIIFWYFSLL